MKKFIAILVLGTIFLPVLANADNMNRYIMSGDSAGLLEHLQYEYINHGEEGVGLKNIEYYVFCEKHDGVVELVDTCKAINIEVNPSTPYYYQLKKELEAIVMFFYELKEKHPNPDKHLDIYGRFQNEILGTSPEKYYETLEFSRQDKQ